jgi:hypothetical protein
MKYQPVLALVTLSKNLAQRKTHYGYTSASVAMAGI